MNSTIKSLVVIFALFTSVAIAKSPAIVTVSETDVRSVFNIKYKNAESGTVKISIYDDANALIFSETLNNVSSFVRPYNFSELKKGEYTIVVADKKGEQVQTINYADAVVSSFIKVSEIPNMENKYVLNVTNTGAEDIHVKIFANDNILIHEQTERVKGSFGLVYNLSKIKSASSVTFEITTAGGKIEKVTF